MKTVLYIFILLSIVNCGKECKYDMVGGLCLNSNGFSVDKNAVLQTIAITEQEVNKQYNDIDLSKALEDHDIDATYVLQETIDCNTSEYTTGCYKNESIEVRFLTEQNHSGVKYRCKANYEVLAHEILHFVLKYHLNISKSKNANHSHYVFSPGGTLSKIKDEIAYMCDELN